MNTLVTEGYISCDAKKAVTETQNKTDIAFYLNALSSNSVYLRVK